MIAADVASHSVCRSSSVNSVTRSTIRCAGGGAAAVSARGLPEVSAIVSGCPAKKVAEDSDTDLLAFLDMELSTGPVAGRDHGHHRSAIIGHRDRFLRIASEQGVAVYEVDVVTRLQPRKLLMSI